MMDAGRKDRVEVSVRQVRPGEADLLGRPPVVQGKADLAGRARVDADEPEASDEREDLGLALSLHGEPEPERDARALERAHQRPRLILDRTRS